MWVHYNLQIIKYLLTMDNDLITFKTIVLGAQGSGKSSLVLRYIKGEFSQQYNVTVGVEFSSKVVELPSGKYIKMQVWDTSGQQTFRAIVRSFYKGIAGIFLTFQLNDPQSLKELEVWIKEIREYAHEEVMLFLVGTKCDLEDKKVEQEEALNFLKEVGCAFYIETSSKYGYNIEELFKKSAEVMYKKYTINMQFKHLVCPVLASGIRYDKAQSFNLNKTMKKQNRQCCS